MSEVSVESPPARTPMQRLVLLIGSVGPCGHLPASGTATVGLVGVPAVWLVSLLGPPLWAYVAGVLVFTGLSVWIHQVGDQWLGEKDSRKLVLDELVGYFIAMTALPATWPVLILGFFIERGIDILKIWPANWVERRWPGGWGVVGDDVVAGLYTLGILYGLTQLQPNWLAL
jgi:phosphatidylglycerophosphatase A